MNHCPRALDVIAANLLAVAVDIPINGRPCLISNTGAQPAYFHPTTTATVANGFLVPAMTQMLTKFSVKNNLSVISNATGTSVAVLILDI
jgi:hypothetical protein